jgi:LmbE family N-acetylglucosaminyl deacetylase
VKVFDINLQQFGRKIVILAAHPDDEVLGVGGTLAYMAKKGGTIVPVIFCENSTVRYDTSMINILEDAAINCTKTLGLQQPIFLQYPDQKLDTFSILEISQKIEEIIQTHQPSTIFTHHNGDINRDHRVVFEATMVATRPFPGQRVKQVLLYETVSSTEWGHPSITPSFEPNIFINISETLETKIKAFSYYESEVKPFPHPRSFDAIKVRAKDWGARVGLPAAEAFQLVRSIF